MISENVSVGKAAPQGSGTRISTSQTVAPFSTIIQGEVKGVTPGQAGIRTPRVLGGGSCLPARPREGRQLPCPSPTRRREVCCEK